MRLMVQNKFYITEHNFFNQNQIYTKLCQMSRTQNLKNMQREPKDHSQVGHESKAGCSGNTASNYCSYFYRDPPPNTNISPSPSSSNANTVAISKSKDSKKLKATRLVAKNNNSNIYGDPKRYGEEKIKVLEQENAELRNEIVNLKVNQFYQFDNNKLKDLIGEVERLKAEVDKLKKENEWLRIENDFLNRNNHHLKMRGSELAESHKPAIRESTQKLHVLRTLKSPQRKQRKQFQQAYQTDRVINPETHRKRALKDLQLPTTIQLQPEDINKIKIKRDQQNPKNPVKLSKEKLLKNYINKPKKINSEGSENEY